MDRNLLKHPHRPGSQIRYAVYETWRDYLGHPLVRIGLLMILVVLVCLVMPILLFWFLGFLGLV